MINNFSDKSLSSLSALVKLRDLVLTQLKITGMGFKHLGNLTQLRTLCIMECFLFTDRGMAECASAFKGLHSFTFGFEYKVRFDDHKYRAMSRDAWFLLAYLAHPALTRVVISGINLTPADRMLLRRFEVLTEHDIALLAEHGIPREMQLTREQEQFAFTLSLTNAVGDPPESFTRISLDVELYKVLF